MRKNVLLAFIMLFYYYSFSQDSVLLALRFMPQTNYSQFMVQKMHIEMGFIGNDSILNKIREKGVSNPTIIDKSFNIKTLTTTGTINSEGKMPVEMDIIKSVDQDGKETSSSGMKIFGTTEIDKPPLFDSISEKIDNEDLKNAILKSFQSINSQISFPDKKMATGDEFKKETPVTMNIAGINLSMNFSSIYKLVSLTPDTAYFTIDVKYTLNLESNKAVKLPMTGGGVGSGTFSFDRKKEYPLSYDFHYEMNLNVKKDNVSVIINMKDQITQNTTISGKLSD